MKKFFGIVCVLASFAMAKSYGSSSSSSSSSRSSYSKPTSSSNYSKPITNSYPVKTTTTNSYSSNGYKSSGYSSYNRPLTRTPSWYSSGYSYRFSNSRYSTGYSYYPIYCDPWHGVLSSMIAGAIVTQMVLDNGIRQPIYADGTGGAYTVINGMRVEVAQDMNGNWVQLSPMQTQVSVAQPVATTVVTQNTRVGTIVLVFFLLAIIVALIVLGYNYI